MLLLVVLVTAAFAFPALPKMDRELPTWKTRAADICWPSGMRTVAVDRSGTGLAAITTVIHGGSAGETPEAPGAAHLLEHLWFRSPGPDGVTVADATVGIAADAETTQDSTVFTTVGPAADLRALLALEARRLTDPLAGITEEVFEAEKAVVMRELSYRGEHSERAALREIARQLYPDGHPYGGEGESLEAVRRLTLDQVRAYARRWYRPEHTTIRLEGDVPFQSSELEAVAREVLPPPLLTGGGSGCVHPTRARVPAGVDATVRVVEAPIADQRLYLGWSLPPAYGPHDVAMRLTLEMMENELWVWLHSVKGLRTVGTHKHAVACRLRPGALASTAVCTVTLPAEVDGEAAIRAARAAVSTVWTGPDPASRQHLILALRVRQETAAVLRWWEAMDADSLSHRARWTHHTEARDVQPELISTFMVTREIPAQVGATFLTAERMAAVRLVPVPVSFTSDAVGAITPVLEARSAPRWSRATPDLSGLHHQELENGLDVYALPHRHDVSPLAGARLVLAGGWAAAPESGLDDALGAMVTLRSDVSLEAILYETGVAFSHHRGARALSGDTIGSGASLDVQAWTLRVFGDTLPADFDYAGRQRAIDDWRDVWFASDDRAKVAVGQDPWILAESHRRRWLLPNDPAGDAVWDRMDAARFVREGRIRSWHRTVKDPANGAVLLTGKLDLDEVRAVVDRYLGGWKARKRDPVPVPAPLAAPPDRDVAIFHKARPLTSVELTCRLPGRTPDNGPVQDVLAEVLGRALWLTFRDVGVTYTPEASVEPVRGDVSLLHLSMEVQRGRGVEAITAMMALLSEVAAGAPEGVVDEARYAAALDFTRALADTAGTLDVLERNFLVGGTHEDLQSRVARIHEVQPSDLSALLEPCVGHEAVTLVGVPTLDELHAAGLEGAREVDWSAQVADIVRRLR